MGAATHRVGGEALLQETWTRLLGKTAVVLAQRMAAAVNGPENGKAGPGRSLLRLPSHLEHHTGPLYHLDLYRLDTVSAVESVVHHVDLARYIEDLDALCFIEWGEQLPDALLTRPPLRIHLDYGQALDERVVWTHDGIG